MIRKSFIFEFEYFYMQFVLQFFVFIKVTCRTREQLFKFKVNISK